MSEKKTIHRCVGCRKTALYVTDELFCEECAGQLRFYTVRFTISNPNWKQPVQQIYTCWADNYKTAIEQYNDSLAFRLLEAAKRYGGSGYDMTAVIRLVERRDREEEEKDRASAYLVLEAKKGLVNRPLYGEEG